jgi:linoleoyl-CoA desaturase
MNTQPQLTRDQIEAFGAELDALRQHVASQLGERDARYIRGIVRIARGSAITGRCLLMFGVTPVSWTFGVAALSTAKILENMEIGHNVMHGQYDWMNDAALCSQTYEWDNVCDSGQWRHYHNYEHHTFTNILGKDRDIGYDVLRMSSAQPWRPHHLAQPLLYAGLATLFQWGVGLHDLDLPHALEPGVDREELGRKWGEFRRKAARQLFKDYVFFPLLALANAPRVLLGNAAANLVRNVWTNVIIFCGHFPEGTRVYSDAESRNESRADWYLRQLHGSANIEGGRAFHVLTGHLSHQIEHHLFPDLPAHRYPEIANQVRAICARYELPYNTGGFWKQYGSVVKNVFKYALPNRASQPALA